VRGGLGGCGLISECAFHLLLQRQRFLQINKNNLPFFPHFRQLFQYFTLLRQLTDAGDSMNFFGPG
jgi:hypothetical protein